MTAALQAAREGNGDELLNRRAAFAETLIIHRFGLTDVERELPSVDDPEPVAIGALVFASVRPGTARRDRALKAIKRELPWFDTTGRTSMRCSAALGCWRFPSTRTSSGQGARKSSAHVPPSRPSSRSRN